MTTEVDNAALRDNLREYVTAWIEHDGGVNESRLARLVVDAPAFQTLTGEEWWNVALMLSLRLRHLEDTVADSGDRSDT
jgi:hypothetical protein